MRGHLLQPFLPVAFCRDADAAHQFGLADIDGGDPVDNLFLVVRFRQHRSSSPHPIHKIALLQGGHLGKSLREEAESNPRARQQRQQ
jgi:hypothetical protein